MFGIYRTLLALGVVAQHLVGARMTGNYAVFGFYILSGYLMTYIMQNNYGYSATGKSRYATNRFLRIYPTYWVASLTTLVLILWIGEDVSREFHNAMYMPGSAAEILANLFLVLPHDYLPRLTPPAWALTVELCFYILIGLGLSKNRFTTTIWLMVAVLFHVVALYMDLPFSTRYYSVYAAALPFATGAMIFHYRDELARWVRSPFKVVDPYLPLLFWLALGLNWYVADTQLFWNIRSAGFYTNFLLCASMVVVLLNRPLLPFIPKWLDAEIGDLSYPIYLIHLQAGLIVFAGLGAMGLDYGSQDIRILLLALPLIFAGSWLLNSAISHPVNQVREIVKKAELGNRSRVSP